MNDEKRRRQVKLIHYDEQFDAAVREQANNLPEERREEFKKFLTDGEASQDFLDWFNANQEVQRLAEKLFKEDKFFQDPEVREFFDTI